MQDIEVRSELEVGKRVLTHGIDWGPKGIILMHLQRRGDVQYGILKNPGHQTWAGVGMGQRYAETNYQIVKFYRGRAFYGDGESLYLSQFHATRTEPGHRWRDCLRHMKTVVAELVYSHITEDQIGQRFGELL